MNQTQGTGPKNGMKHGIGCGDTQANLHRRTRKQVAPEHVPERVAQHSFQVMAAQDEEADPGGPRGRFGLTQSTAGRLVAWTGLYDAESAEAVGPAGSFRLDGETVACAHTGRKRYAQCGPRASLVGGDGSGVQGL